VALGPTRLPGAHSELPDYLEAHPRMGLEWAEQTRARIHAARHAADACVQNAVTDMRKMSENAVTEDQKMQKRSSAPCGAKPQQKSR
jgi:hypothetical protein